jgi:hypothetical protein
VMRAGSSEARAGSEARAAREVSSAYLIMIHMCKMARRFEWWWFQCQKMDIERVMIDLSFFFFFFLRCRDEQKKEKGGARGEGGQLGVPGGYTYV